MRRARCLRRKRGTRQPVQVVTLADYMLSSEDRCSGQAAAQLLLWGVGCSECPATHPVSHQRKRGGYPPQCRWLFLQSVYEKKMPFRSLPSKANSVIEVLAGSETNVSPSSRKAAHLMVAEVLMYLPANVFTGSCNSKRFVIPLQLIS